MDENPPTVQLRGPTTVRRHLTSCVTTEWNGRGVNSVRCSTRILKVIYSFLALGRRLRATDPTAINTFL
jgi:hypothetical protein